MSSAREAVARAIFHAVRPDSRWEDQPAGHLEWWGGIADAAMAAMPTGLDRGAGR